MANVPQVDTSQLPRRLVEALAEYCPELEYELDEDPLADEMALFRFPPGPESDYGFEAWVYDGDGVIGSIMATVETLREKDFTWGFTLETWDAEPPERGVEQLFTTVLALLTHETRIMIRQGLLMRRAMLLLRVGENDAIGLSGWSQLGLGRPKRAEYAAQPVCASHFEFDEEDLVPAGYSVFL